MANVPSDLNEQLVKVVADAIGRDKAELKPEVNFWNDLGVDSIKAIEIVVAIERNFKVSIRDEQIPKIATVGQAIDIVRGALEKK